MKYTTYLFDFDGTLVDSMPSYVRAMLRILDERGIKYGNDIIKIITPLGYAATARYYREKYGLAMTEEEIVALMKSYAYDAYANSILAKGGVENALKKLKAEGASLNILTASPHEVLDVCLMRLGLYDLFTSVWSCEDFGSTKADPVIYKMAAQRMGVKPCEFLFLDDNLNALKTAREAGACVCGVYDPTSEDSTEQIKAVAHHYIKDFDEIFSI